MMRLIFVALFTVSMGASAATAAFGPFDPSFGDGGLRSYGFVVGPTSTSDFSFASCPGPGETLDVLGHTSAAVGTGMLRLDDDGNIDTSFGTAGWSLVPVEAMGSEVKPVLCEPDGGRIVVREHRIIGGPRFLKVFRIDAATGQLDTSFGVDGIATIDFDDPAKGLEVREFAKGIQRLANGQIVVSGEAIVPGVSAGGFVALLSHDGDIVRTATLADPRSRDVTTVMDGPDGRLWAYGQNALVPGIYRATLERDTLAWVDCLVFEAPEGRGGRVGAGVRIDADTVVMPVSRALPMTGVYGTPELVVFRATRADLLALPAPRLGGNAYWIRFGIGAPSLVALPQRRVAYAAEAASDGTHPARAVYFAMAEIGGDAASDRVDSAFGEAGAQLGGFVPPMPACATESPAYSDTHLTLWRGKVLYSGTVYAACTGPDATPDFVVARLVQSDVLFADGFDGA